MKLSHKTNLLCLLSVTHLLYCSFPASAFAKNNETDRLALLDLKAKITDDPFGILTSWNSSLHFCQWYGVTCGRRHQRVTMLDLRSLKLSGSISPHVGNLTFLKMLNLQNNSFSHEIPPQIDHLQRLQILLLNNNSISGRIPDNISACSNLIQISFRNNNLVGKIPAGLGSLLKLKILYLGANNLIGTIPPSVGNMSSLEEVFAYKNHFRENLPDSLGQLMSFRILAVSENKFSGTIPPSIFNLSTIEAIDVGDNQLTGTLPSDLGISLPNLYFFSIGMNQFSGKVPTSVSNSTNLEIFELGENNLIGGVPSLENLQKLSVLIIYANHLGTGKTGDLTFLSTLRNATALRLLQVSSNNFGGKLTQNLGNFSKKLEKIDVGNNQIFGSIPTGIEFLVNLKVLIADWNKLSGTIPTSIGKLRHLESVRLENNSFMGYIPSSLGNLTKLFEIDLSINNLEGTIPSNLGNWKNLQSLVFSSNNLGGSIPPQLLGLSSLSIILDLSRNNLSGSLPIEVGNLKNLGSLLLHENMLSGEIPSSLGSCVSLVVLSMGGNNFQRSIPSSLSSLRGIQELNLSRNNLSGMIPEFLKGFNSLQLLDLSYNDFEGIVPTEGVFKNSSTTSVAGNKNLCGGIPDFELPACKFGQSERRLTVKLKIIISAVSVLAAAAFVVICLFLCHSRKSTGELVSHSDALLKLSYQSLLKATNGFSSENLIGIGSFGAVYKGNLDQEGITIAVKVLNLSRQGASKSFIAECKVLRNVRHRNLVKVLTACSGVDYRGNDFKALVYEFMNNGSLDSWLHPTLGFDDHSRSTLNALQRLNIAIDIACALEYLHHHSGTPIVHCDLKPSNVLLDEEMTGHVSDFGLVKFLSKEILDYSTNQSSSIGVRGTIGYCPPEYGVGSEVSTSGDIFSFGILLLETFTGRRPTDDMFEEGLSLHNFVKRALPAQVTDIIDPNLLKMQQNADATSLKTDFPSDLIPIFDVGISCSAELPQERMNIGDIIAQLSTVRKKLLETH